MNLNSDEDRTHFAPAGFAFETLHQLAAGT
jgi:hypothetical protein